MLPHGILKWVITQLQMIVSSCKLYTNGQQMKVYELTICIIHVECDDIMLNHRL
jgi:hypothetical protein